MCVWESGNQASSQYTLFILQRKTCKVFDGISITSQIITRNDLFEKRNMTVYVVEENDVGNCTKAVFTGIPQDLVRCGPPTKVHFNRRSRQMEVNVSWQPKSMGINQYIVRYWAHENQTKETPTVLSRDVETCIVDNLNASLPYEIQIQCVASEKCRQCLWSDIFRVSPELTVEPFLEEIKEIPQPEGRRIIVIKWKFAEAELAEGYNVTVVKLSGETFQTFNYTRPEISLVLSHSAYLLNISAFHSAATSPALEWTIAPFLDKDLPPERLNVTFSGNSSFVISWQRDLVKTYDCFCVEWWRKREKPAFWSFYEKENHYEVITLKEPLQPYERYTFTLHTRPNKDTCDLKKINNSETTYGNIQAYITEGREFEIETHLVI
ncbi:uncharacterized protein [Osmerus mordax]|uniref:uncharacterized protein n=1 Tax=Osmerus mordax TaxID=8014 RepID=UPI00350FC155